MMNALAEVKSARKRALSMGRYSGWRREYDRHPLAACVDNYTACIDAERENKSPDWLAILGFILAIARRINGYCDDHKVADDPAAQYWLERFLWRCDSVCAMDVLTR